jgi:hypothetical protein
MEPPTLKGLKSERTYNLAVAQKSCNLEVDHLQLQIKENSTQMVQPARKECLLQNIKTCKFVVLENPDADGSEPIYEIAAFSAVSRNSALIDRVARELMLDGRLIRAVMYMETTHGYYDAPLAILGMNKSVLPMNVNVEYWGSTFGNRQAMNDPYKNIRAGAEILKRITANVPQGTSVRHIATLYNNINAQRVSDYGARVEKIYLAQPWLRKAEK